MRLNAARADGNIYDIALEYTFKVLLMDMRLDYAIEVGEDRPE